MRSHIPISKRISSKDYAELREDISRFGVEQFQKQTEAAMRRWFMLLAVTLNQSFGFGEKRLIKVFQTVANLIKIHDTEDVEFWTHVEKRCEQLNILQYLKGENNGH